MRKSLGTVTMAVAMVVAMAVPAMAAPAGNITSSTESITYNGDDGQAYEGAWDATENETTEVSVAQGSYFTVKAPKEITVVGAKNLENSATFNVTVSGDIAGDVVVRVVPNTAHTNSEGTTVADNFDRTAGTGTFAMKEKAGVKKDLTATITMTDTDWTMADDGVDDGTGPAAITNVVKSGKVVIADLSSGYWGQNIGFIISAEKAVTTP